MTNHKNQTHPQPPRSQRPVPPARRLAIVLPAVLLAIIAGTPAAGLAAPAGPTPRAHTARTLKVTDAASLRYIKHTGSQLLEEGSAKGDLPGSMRANCTLGATFTASFTINTHGGTITGHGTATPHGAGLDEHFSGTLTITGGTGSYTHAHGHAGLSGTFNRRTYAITLQTSGSLSY